MSKITLLSLLAAPTFTAPVGIPVAGGDPVVVPMTFKHRTRDELDAFVESRKGKTDAETFTDMVVGWGLEDAFTPENIATLLQNRIGTALAAYHIYVEELTKAREKN